MFKLKKAGSFLAILMVFSVVVGSFPIQAVAEVYTGELQLPNTNVVSDYRQAGGGQVPLSTFNNSYFPGAPTLSERADSNFMTSLPQKIFSASMVDGILNCSSSDINVNPANNSIVLTGIGYNNDENSTTYSSLCQPTARPTTQNTVLSNSGSGNSYGGLGVIQTYDALPFTTLGESMQNTSVESIPNDPNNVRVTVSENVTQEAYGLHFERRGDVERVLNGDYRLWFEDNGFYQDGKTYVINWITDWNGYVPTTMCRGDDYCFTTLSGQSAGIDEDNHIVVDNTLLVDTGYPTQQITQLASIAPALVSSSIVRPRNGDILSETQPVCTRWSDGGMWRNTQHIYCIRYAITADGRTGRAIIYDSASSSGWFRDLLGASLMLAGLVSGAEFVTAFLEASEWTAAFVMDQVVPNILGGAISHEVMNALDAFTVASIAAIAGPTVYGTAEEAIASSGVEGQERIWIWSWSTAPEFRSTTNICANGSLDWPTCPDSCTNGATNYPTCGCTNGAPFSSYPTCILVRDLCPDGTPRPPTGCPTTDTDLCLNITGFQTEVPAGYTRDAFGNCNLDNTNDLCRNIDGVQRVVPAGYERDASGNCNRGGTDLCPNIEGIQLTVPDGYTRNSVGLCISNNTPSIDTWQVVPTLVRSGEPTFVSWTTKDVSSCTVSSTNGDLWSGASWLTGTREPSLPILGQTIFSITCDTSSGATVSTSTRIVNIIPTFQER